MSDGPDHAGVVAPPPLLFAGTLLLGLLLDRLLPTPLWPAGIAGIGRIAGIVLFVAAVALGLWAVRTFHAAGTAVRPWQPSTALARSGPYRLTRNPMYLGMVLGTVGLALALDDPWLLGLAVPLALVLRFGVIAREEAYLERRFGQGYRDYKAGVRRWL